MRQINISRENLDITWQWKIKPGVEVESNLPATDDMEKKFTWLIEIQKKP